MSFPEGFGATTTVHENFKKVDAFMNYYGKGEGKGVEMRRKSIEIGEVIRSNWSH